MMNSNTLKISDIEAIRPEATPFALLAMLPSYDLDEEVLERHYLILQRELHPDRFVGKSHEAEVASMMIGWINKAYKTLKNPVERAKSLLKIAGAQIPGEGDKTIEQPDILFEAMEWREHLAQISTEKDLTSFRGFLEGLFDKKGNEFSRAWQEKDLTAMQEIYLYLTYISKTLTEAKETAIDIHEKRA